MMRKKFEIRECGETRKLGEDIGIVVIGRNEGERLLRCLESLINLNYPIVYVDSCSSDDSVVVAKSLVQFVVELDSSFPLSAGRARNQGFNCLLEQFPALQFVQFVDGDCVLVPGWLEEAKRALEDNPRCSAVVGHLQECFPDATPYNRLCALEWKAPAGDLENFGSFGGISMVRAKVFHELGGFNQTIIAGEDSELGVRMKLAGYKIIKIDSKMAIHDAHIRSFRQWWIRAVRAGHAIGQRADLNGKTEAKDCIRERKSTWFWGIALPGFIISMLIPTSGYSLIFLGGYIFLFFRVSRYRKGRGDSMEDARLYARFQVIAKFANGLGLIKYYLNKISQRYEIIEYK